MSITAPQDGQLGVSSVWLAPHIRASPTTDSEAIKAEHKRLKRLRQTESRTPEESRAHWHKVKMSEYNSWLRIAAGTYVQVPGDYYESDMGVCGNRHHLMSTTM